MVRAIPVPAPSLRTPDDDELLEAVREVTLGRDCGPVSIKNIIKTVKRNHPQWLLSERRVKKLRALKEPPRTSMGSSSDEPEFDDFSYTMVPCPTETDMLGGLLDDGDEGFVLVSYKD
eukprot:CAMPEP_0206276834 /NCGR_PEP_ID=MMETSP0047_2-20121206/36517_1 /ASSEMBLY_ACC=CAM_ASM_000192 /TAXON_ID=195065 /ORGANISM="Chroomonas mesostigmatica_cf, Strain CCMP1168" /LENGTH=117 /DNA_ID=CAMNT_0053706377 /DNA_START=13 /DNA_END=366 /DNA_ORIENTATION=-